MAKSADYLIFSASADGKTHLRNRILRQMPSPATAPPIVDVHAHVYKRDMPQPGTAWHRPPADATTEDYLATLDKAGVRFGVLAAASTYGDYNDYALEATRNNKRLRTTVIVHPDCDPFVLREMNDSGAV